jgi:hypothetical protein
MAHWIGTYGCQAARSTGDDGEPVIGRVIRVAPRGAGCFACSSRAPWKAEASAPLPTRLRLPAAAYPPSRRGRLYRCDLTDGTRRATVAFLRLSLPYAVSVGSARLTAPAAGV